MTFRDQSSFANRTSPAGASLKLFPAFYEAAHEALGDAYPERWCQLGHHLVGHALLDIPAIVRLAENLQPAQLDAVSAHRGESMNELFDQILAGKACLTLNEIDRDPQYDALMRDALTEVKPLIRSITGEMLLPAASLVIAGPYSAAPPKLDTAYSIHFQIAGSRSVTAFPAVSGPHITAEDYERCCSEFPHELPWNDALFNSGETREVAPGEALYAPVFTPYGVTVHEEVSVSLCLSWRSRWSQRYYKACQFNARLRNAGISADPVRCFPRDNHVKAFAWSAWQRWDLAKERLRKERAAWR